MSEQYINIIKEALKLNNMTQRELADRMQITPQTLNAIFHKRSPLRLDDFIHIAEILNLDLSSVFLKDGQLDIVHANMMNLISQLDKEQLQVLMTLIKHFNKENMHKKTEQ